MPGTPTPNEEREKEYKQLQNKADEIYKVIAGKFPEMTPFDLGCFSAISLLRMAPIFEDDRIKMMLVNIVRYFVTLSLEMKTKPENETPNEHMAKKPLLYGANGEKL